MFLYLTQIKLISSSHTSNNTLRLLLFLSDTGEDIENLKISSCIWFCSWSSSLTRYWLNQLNGTVFDWHSVDVPFCSGSCPHNPVIVIKYCLGSLESAYSWQRHVLRSNRKLWDLGWGNIFPWSCILFSTILLLPPSTLEERHRNIWSRYLCGVQLWGTTFVPRWYVEIS